MSARALSLLVLFLASPVAAQTPLATVSLPSTVLTLQPAPAVPQFGLSRWATWLNYAGPVANVVTQEIAFAKFGAYDQFIGKRATVAGLSLGLAGLTHLLSRWLPRDHANGQAIAVAAWGAFDAGRNLHVLVTVRR